MEKNNKTVIILLIIIIAILSALCVLFATGTITFKSYDTKVNNPNQSTDKVESVATMELIDPDNNKTYDKVNITLELKDNNWIITSYKK